MSCKHDCRSHRYGHRIAQLNCRWLDQFCSSSAQRSRTSKKQHLFESSRHWRTFPVFWRAAWSSVVLQLQILLSEAKASISLLSAITAAGRLWKSTKLAVNTTGRLTKGHFRHWQYFLTDFCRVTSTYLWPFKEDVTRFDFEVDKEDEQDCIGWL